MSLVFVINVVLTIAFLIVVGLYIKTTNTYKRIIKDYREIFPDINRTMADATDRLIRKNIQLDAAMATANVGTAVSEAFKNALTEINEIIFYNQGNLSNSDIVRIAQLSDVGTVVRAIPDIEEMLNEFKQTQLELSQQDALKAHETYEQSIKSVEPSQGNERVDI